MVWREVSSPGGLGHCRIGYRVRCGIVRRHCRQKTAVLANDGFMLFLNRKIHKYIRREAPMPPLEGEVVERQRNQRGLYVNRAVQGNPLSQPIRAASSPFRGAEGASRHGETLKLWML